MSIEPYELNEEVRVRLPEGSVYYAGVYEGHRIDLESSSRTYGFSINAGLLPERLTYEVEAKEHGDVNLISVRSRVKPEVRLTGLGSAEAEFQWLLDREKEMSLRNLGMDAIFRRYPLQLLLSRYSYPWPLPSMRSERDERPQIQTTRLGLKLHELVVVAS